MNIFSLTRLTTLMIMVLTMTVSLCAKDFTIVIDPGHGGKDNGAPGEVTNEKTVNLRVAKGLSDLIHKRMPDAKVVMTRSDDRFIPLQERANIANKASGDLFVSIHCNSVDKKSKNRKTVHGASVYTLGLKRSDENLSVAMRENEVMKLEDDYSTTYQGFDPSSTESYIVFELSQNNYMEHSIRAANAVQRELVKTAGRANRGVRQANFWVLLKTGMPSMLVELDFICNPQSESFMHSERGCNKLVNAIFNGISTYKQSVDRERKIINGGTEFNGGADTEAPDPVPSETVDDKPTPATAEVQAPRSSAITYHIQFLTSPTRIGQGSGKLKGLKDTNYYLDHNTYKYYYGDFASEAEAKRSLNTVRKKFPDAFIIRLQDGKRIR